MDKQHIKGGMKEAEGEIKKAAGKMTGDKRLEAEGYADKIEGKVRKAAGDVKDAARDAKQAKDAKDTTRH